ncbi:MAG: efflux RND transporter periplasmic adaptor subunit [Mariniblastus sp.]|nr:efflux RND transporter periplasmic adaptor subunit [Mariniblastus sp.]
MLLLFNLTACKQETPIAAPVVPSVTVQKPVVKTIPLFHEENGETEAVDQAVVRARVSGILREMKYVADDTVEKDQVLFVIEKDEYQALENSQRAGLQSAQAAQQVAEAALLVAQAKIDSATAQSAAAQAEYQRMRSLAESNAVSKSEIDSAEAQNKSAAAAVESAKAGLAASQAEVASAKAMVSKSEAELERATLNLNWCDVRAPIAGRVTRNVAKIGNLINVGDELTSIIKENPIWANFNISERFLLDFQRENKEKQKPERELSSIKVTMQRNGDEGFPFEGVLDYYDPQVDYETGTVKFRAVFQNDQQDQKLLPGQFVRVRIQMGNLENALLVPEKCIIREASGDFVFLLGDDSKVERRQVVLGIKDGENIVVQSGLKPEDQVVVDGIQRLFSGQEVSVK